MSSLAGVTIIEALGTLASVGEAVLCGAVDVGRRWWQMRGCGEVGLGT